MAPVFHPKALLAAFAVTLVTAAMQTSAQAPGIFGDPIVAMLLRAVSIVLSLALSATIIIACIKMIAYFGAAGEAQRHLSAVVKEAGEKFDAFAHEMRNLWQSHDREIATLKANHTEHEKRIDGHDDRIGEVERRHYSRREIDRKD